ncbi:hypothetical protein GOODEAATRI_027516 [Goodea atripinnis]|uniref:SAM domain-containing protein n=1 Tax=Goodea atripinnis TaxID=208336 RepID=A0ABV0PSY8_9TELE
MGSGGGYSLSSSCGGSGSSRSPSPLTLMQAVAASGKPFASKPMELWSKHDVADWLESLNLGEHKDAFLDNEIEGAHLPSLQKEDLIDLAQFSPAQPSPAQPSPAPPCASSCRGCLKKLAALFLHPSTSIVVDFTRARTPTCRLTRSDPSSFGFISPIMQLFQETDIHNLCSVNISRTVAGVGQCCYNPVFKLTAACWRR